MRLPPSREISASRVGEGPSDHSTSSRVAMAIPSRSPESDSVPDAGPSAIATRPEKSISLLAPGSASTRRPSNRYPAGVVVTVPMTSSISSRSESRMLRASNSAPSANGSPPVRPPVPLSFSEPNVMPAISKVSASASISASISPPSRREAEPENSTLPRRPSMALNRVVLPVRSSWKETAEAWPSDRPVSVTGPEMSPSSSRSSAWAARLETLRPLTTALPFSDVAVSSRSPERRFSCAVTAPRSTWLPETSRD